MLVRSEEELRSYTESPDWDSRTERRSVTIAYGGLTNSQLTALLGKIQTVRGGVLIETCSGLTEIVLDELTTVGGGFEVLILPGCIVERNQKEVEQISLGLTTIKMPNLVTVEGDLIIYDSDELVELNLDSLETVGVNRHTRGGKLSLYADSNALKELALPSLRLVGGDFSVWRFYGVEELSLPALETVGGFFEVRDFLALGPDLLLPSLLTVGSTFKIQNAKRLRW